MTSSGWIVRRPGPGSLPCGS
ncbi:MAG: hypothetical protein QOH62_3737, partial [Solirubrobacteraceae bacterium]|nr:hypothetical protein [Solirubrobacteraceae bacterium]